MIMAVFAKIGRVKSPERSGHNEIEDYNSLNM